MAQLIRAKERRCNLAFFVLATIAFAATADSAATKDPSCRNGPLAVKVNFVPFWKDFRSSALSGDFGSLLSLVQLPLPYSGVLDTDPKQSIDRTDFPVFFSDFLNSDSGVRQDFFSVRNLISGSACVADDIVDPGGTSAQLGPMTFRRIHSHWKLTGVSRTSE